MRLDTLSMKMLKTLQRGKARLDEEAINKVAHFIESQCIDETVFMDKNGKGDLYYTLFGLMLSYVFDVKINNNKLRAYLESLDSNTMDLIHYAAYIRCLMLMQLIQGGKLAVFLKYLFSRKKNRLKEFASFPHDDLQSPYSQFILLSLMEDMGIKIKDKKAIIDSLKAYNVSGGGYSNIKGSDTASSNATAAALSVLGQLEGYSSNQDIRYIHSIQDTSGGFSATAYAPIPDLLSTATLLFLLSCYGLRPQHSPATFIEGHWLESGGFSPTILDDKSDVEYTFYGILALGS